MPFSTLSSRRSNLEPVLNLTFAYMHSVFLIPSLARMQNLIFLCAFLATNLIWALPNSLQQLCDAKPSSYQSCHRDLHTLSNAQLVLEKDGLFKLLRSESLPINWEIDEWFALKNDLMDRFIAAKQCIVALSAYNLAVLEDNTSHPIWRDYCLQKQADLIAAHPMPSQQCNKLITAQSLCTWQSTRLDRHCINWANATD